MGRLTHYTGDFYHIYDFPNIQAAIDYAYTNDGGNVLIPNGTHPFDAPLSVPPEVTLVGTNRGTAVLDWRGDADVAISFDDYCVLRDFTLKGRGIVGLGTSPTAARWTIQRVKVTGFDEGVRLSNTWIGSIRDCIINLCDVGLRQMAPCNIILVSGGEIQACSTGVLLDGGKAPRFEAATIEGNTTYGINAAGAVHNLIVRDCWFELNGGSDVRLGGVVSGMIEGSLFAGTQLGVVNEGGSKVFVEGNWFRTNGTPLTIGPGASDTVVGVNHFEWSDTIVDDSSSTVYR